MREGAKGRGLTRMCGCGEEAEVGWDHNIICVGCGRRPATLLWQRENSLYLDKDGMKLVLEVYAIIGISVFATTESTCITFSHRIRE